MWNKYLYSLKNVISFTLNIFKGLSLLFIYLVVLGLRCHGGSFLWAMASLVMTRA